MSECTCEYYDGFRAHEPTCPVHGSLGPDHGRSSMYKCRVGIEYRRVEFFDVQGDTLDRCADKALHHARNKLAAREGFELSVRGVEVLGEEPSPEPAEDWAARDESEEVR